MALGFATLAGGLGVLLLTLIVSVTRRVHQWVQEQRVDSSAGVSLPPDEMGVPLIGNMWAFLRVFRSGKLDAFIGSFIRRSMIFHVTHFLSLPPYCVFILIFLGLTVTSYNLQPSF
jgi:hypothetical protein